MPLPRWVALFNKRVTNRLAEPLARRFANFAIVHHVGRRTGTKYATPVNYFAAGARTLVVALTYGPNADWIRNLVDGPGSLEIAGRIVRIEDVALVGREEAWQFLPRVVRLVLRVLRVHSFAALSHSGGYYVTVTLRDP